MAKLAVTPPVVGSVRTEMYGKPARSRRASAAETLAICISDSVPSIMRAPPEHETMITGRRRAGAVSMPRDDLLAHDHAHAAADERVLHRGDHGLDAVDAADAEDDRVVEAGGACCSPRADRGRAWCR